MRPKVFLAILVGLALLLSFGVTVKDAQADTIMFPWVVKSETVSTIISVVNLAAPNLSTADPYPALLHFQYWHKVPVPYTTDTNHQRNICDEYDFKAYTSKDDLVSFDSSGKINDGLPLWNDNDPLHSNATIFVDDYRLDVPDPVRAFLLVDNNTPNFGEVANTNTDGTIYGEALVLEITTGAAWGYIAYNSSGGTTSYQDDPVYMEDGLDMVGEVIGADETTQTIILNPNSVTTKFFVTPLTDDEDDTIGVFGARSPNSNVRIQLCKRNDDHDGTCQSGGMFNNTEGTVSFTNPKDIVCTSADSLEALMGTAAFSQFADSGQSGWAWLITLAGTVDQLPFDLVPDNSCEDAVIGKLEYTDTALDIDGMTIPTTPGVAGGINSFLWLRDSESVADKSGINYIHNETAN